MRPKRTSPSDEMRSFINIDPAPYRIRAGMPLLNGLLSRPLSSAEEHSERLNSIEGVAVFGLDSLGSAAYGPEAGSPLCLKLQLFFRGNRRVEIVDMPWQLPRN